MHSRGKKNGDEFSPFLEIIISLSPTSHEYPPGLCILHINLNRTLGQRRGGGGRGGTCNLYQVYNIMHITLFRIYSLTQFRPYRVV